MKKLIAMLLCVTLLIAASACRQGANAPAATNAPVATDAPAATEAPAEETAAPEEASAEKTGLYVGTGVSGSVSAGAENGSAKSDSLAVAVTVDANGVITNCVIDDVQAAIGFDKGGKLTTDKATTFRSKNVLGADYGMGKASPIGKEWNEQAAAFAAYCVGKTPDAVQGIALSAEGTAADADLSSSVTIHIGGFMDAVAAAAGNAGEQGAKAGDKLGLAILTNMSKSADATAEAEGVAQAYSTYAVVTVDANGVITSCIIDASQANVKFSAAGEITSDINAPVQTKNEIGAGYGMVKASSIGKEWNEQAAAFAAYCVGKTAAEVQGIAMDGQGLAADADLLSSVTIHIGDFMSVVAAAVENAK